MRTISLWLYAIFCSGALFAQDITGVWQGTMQAQKELRIVARISKDGAAFKAVLYSIDQSNQGMASSSIAIQDGTVKIVVPGIGGGYEGKLNAAVSQMTGTFHQGDLAIPLNLAKATPGSAWAIPVGPPPTILTMTEPDPSVKKSVIAPSRPQEPGFGVGRRGHLMTTVNTPLSALISFAYEVQTKQIVGGPSWIESEKYDVTAESNAFGEPNPQQMRVMMQRLLADRFQLRFHRDQRELAVYVLTVATTGSKLTNSQSASGSAPGVTMNGFGVISGRYAKMSEFTGLLENTALDRPILDRTGLTGRYDVFLRWTPDESQYASFANRPHQKPTSEAPELFEAIYQQLGLKLDATRAPAEVLVIDRVEKPSEN